MRTKKSKAKAKAEAEAATPQTDASPAKVAASRTSLDVATDALVAAPWNPRGRITPESVADLTASIATVGVIEPIIAMRGEAGKYIIVAGHRRAVAAKAAGLATVPCDILGIDEAQARRMTFIENLQRKDADPLLEAELVAQLVADGMTQEEVAAEIGRNRKWVMRRLNLSRLSPSWRKRVAAGEQEFSVDCLEHVAAYPNEIQERLKKCCDTIERTVTWRDLAYSFDVQTRDLAQAPFNKNACRKCSHNTGATPDLFDWHDDKPVAFGKCMDGDCYKRRLADHVASLEQRAKREGCAIVHDCPPCNAKTTATNKPAEANTLFIWTDYSDTPHTAWAHIEKTLDAATSTGAALDAREKQAAEQKQKQKRERNKAIRALAQWCKTDDNLADLLEYWLSDDYTKRIAPFAPFVVQGAFRLLGHSSWQLVGTNTSLEDCARSALFENLTVPDGWANDAAEAVIKSLDTSRNGGFTAEYNALIIVRMLGDDALGALGADAVAAIIPPDADIGKTRNPEIKWLCEERPPTSPQSERNAEDAIADAEG